MIKAFLLGMYEFRRAFSTHFADWTLANVYDRGRELAHMLTLRHYE